MRQLIQITECVLQIKTSNSTAPTTTTGAPASSRVPLYTSNNTRHIRSMTPPNPQVPQLSTPSAPMVDQSTRKNHKHRTKKHKTRFHTTAPLHNTISRTQAAKAPPVSRTRARTQLTKWENKTQTGHTSKVDAAISQLENNFHQYFAVMDTYTGKLLSYRQLTRMSSANEFGQLANGVGGRIKDRTNTITFITRNEIPHNQRKYVTYRKFVCSV